MLAEGMDVNAAMHIPIGTRAASLQACSCAQSWEVHVMLEQQVCG